MSTFNASKGTQARDSAMESVESAATEAWKASAMEAIRFLARKRIEFTTDSVWYYLEVHNVPAPREPRAMGPMMMRAVRAGLCVNTERTRRSIRVECHRRPVAIYRSLNPEPNALPMNEDNGTLFAPPSLMQK